MARNSEATLASHYIDRRDPYYHYICEPNAKQNADESNRYSETTSLWNINIRTDRSGEQPLGLSRHAMDKPQIFVSHISEEGALASIFKQHLLDDFLGLLEVFVSSDIQSIAAGQNWLTSLESALRRSSLLLVLCSHASLRRPWVNFEVGAAWMKQVPIVPICHSGLEPSALPVPFVLLQGLHASSRDGLARLSHAVAKTIDSRAPKGNADQLIAEVEAFEAGYTPTLRAQLGPVTARADAARKRVYDALKDSAFN
jgi:hypothetical protein